MKEAVGRLTLVGPRALHRYLIPGLRRHAVSVGLVLVMVPVALTVALVLRATHRKGGKEQDVY